MTGPAQENVTLGVLQDVEVASAQAPSGSTEARGADVSELELGPSTAVGAPSPIPRAQGVEGVLRDKEPFEPGHDSAQRFFLDGFPDGAAGGVTRSRIFATSTPKAFPRPGRRLAAFQE